MVKRKKLRIRRAREPSKRLSLKSAEAEYIYMLIKDKPSIHAEKIRKKLAGKFKSIDRKEARRE